MDDLKQLSSTLRNAAAAKGSVACDKLKVVRENEQRLRDAYQSLLTSLADYEQEQAGQREALQVVKSQLENTLGIKNGVESKQEKNAPTEKPVKEHIGFKKPSNTLKENLSPMLSPRQMANRRSGTSRDSRRCTPSILEARELIGQLTRGRDIEVLGLPSGQQTPNPNVQEKHKSVYKSPSRASIRPASPRLNIRERTPLQSTTNIQHTTLTNPHHRISAVQKVLSPVSGNTTKKEAVDRVLTKLMKDHQSASTQSIRRDIDIQDGNLDAYRLEEIETPSLGPHKLLSPKISIKAANQSYEALGLPAMPIQTINIDLSQSEDIPSQIQIESASGKTYNIKLGSKNVLFSSKCSSKLDFGNSKRGKVSQLHSPKASPRLSYVESIIEPKQTRLRTCQTLFEPDISSSRGPRKTKDKSLSKSKGQSKMVGMSSSRTIGSSRVQEASVKIRDTTPIIKQTAQSQTTGTSIGIKSELKTPATICSPKRTPANLAVQVTDIVSCFNANQQSQERLLSSSEKGAQSKKKLTDVFRAGVTLIATPTKSQIVGSQDFLKENTPITLNPLPVKTVGQKSSPMNDNESSYKFTGFVGINEPNRTPIKQSANKSGSVLSGSKLCTSPEQPRLQNTPQNSRGGHRNTANRSLLASVDRERLRESSQKRGLDVQASVEELKAIEEIQREINTRFKTIEQKMNAF